MGKYGYKGEKLKKTFCLFSVITLMCSETESLGCKDGLLLMWHRVSSWSSWFEFRFLCVSFFRLISCLGSLHADHHLSIFIVMLFLVLFCSVVY